ncbi:MAG: amidohydrolase family protein [Gemmatimonadales bacterium]
MRLSRPLGSLSLVLLAAAGTALAQRPTIQRGARNYVAVEDPVVAITHVRVVDGTGKAGVADQTVVLRDGRIAALGPSGSTAVPSGARVIDGSGKSLIPGLVGLHDHSYYTTSARTVQSNYSAPLLYLAAGVTTIRTTGANNPYAELNLKRAIEEGRFPGPNMYITGPYITGPGNGQGSAMAGVANEEEARRVVAYWAQEGVQWLKFYTTISGPAMKAAIDEAHKHGLKFTGHLCSVPYREAVSYGIDALEHGLFANSDYDKTREPNRCSPNLFRSFSDLDIQSTEVQATFKALIDNQVALTSTLVVYELFVPNRPPLDPRVLDAMSPDAKNEYLTSRATIAEQPGRGIPLEIFKKGMEYERAFFKAGGLLTSGVDPTGNGGALFGFGDQRNLELLVEGGFTPAEAIQVGSANGAKALGIGDQKGTIQVGRVADLVLLGGAVDQNIADIRNVELVFKGGVGFDSKKMIEAARGQVGAR